LPDVVDATFQTIRGKGNAPPGPSGVGNGPGNTTHLSGRLNAVIEWDEAMVHEIVLPETKPETEWVRGRPLQKVSPQRTHSLLQGALTTELRRWAAERGEAGPEWRFRVAPPGEIRRPLVPDVAYVSNERLRPLSDADLEVPPLAPDVVVEILSSDDRRVDVDDKIDTYLRAGSYLVMVVDPLARIVELHDRSGITRLDESAAIEHTALPEFSYPVRDLFAVLRRA
jgi:Uma2 family endonuclease